MELLLIATFAHAQMRPHRIREHLSIQHPPRMRDFSKNDIHQILGFRDSGTLKRIITALRLPEFFRCEKKRYKMGPDSGERIRSFYSILNSRPYA